jgi:hypothetical protein
MRHAIFSFAVLVPLAFVFLCLVLVAVFAGIALAGGSSIPPWHW